MPVWLRNLQSSVRFNEHLLRLQCGLLLNLLRAGRYDVSVVCLESGGIRNLNRVYRNVDRATDVLAFPYHEVNPVIMYDNQTYYHCMQELRAGTLPEVDPTREEDDNQLGDVILGMSVIGDECRCEGVRLEHRLPVIVTHGLCHLLGYRHDSASQRTLVSESLLTAANTHRLTT